MALEIKTSLVFVDTNIVIELFKCKSLFNAFEKYLCNNNLKILVTDVLCYELSTNKKYLADYSQILTTLPHTLAIPCDKVIEYEIKSYPMQLGRSIEYTEVQDKDEVIRALFAFQVWNKTRKHYEEDRRQAIIQINTFKTGSWEDSWHVAFLWTLNNILKIDKELFMKIRKNPSILDIKAIPSEWIRANIAYEKYILENKEPSLTDLGDFLHTSYIPYCGLVIIENELCRILNKIKRESQYENIKDIIFQNIKFIRSMV